MPAKNPPKKLPDPKSARATRQLTCLELASSANVSISTVTRCESTGEYPKRITVRRRYLAALGLAEVV